MKAQKKQTRLNGSVRLSEIHRVAARIIWEKGYDATSMSEIADAVGITKAGVYHHVPGKRDMLYAIMSYGLDSLENEVITPARAIDEPLVQAEVNSSGLVPPPSGDRPARCE